MWLLRLLVGSWVAEAHWQAEFQEGDESYKGFHLEDKSYEVFTQRIRFSICSHHTVEKSFSMERIVRRIEEELLKIITSTTGKRIIGEDKVSLRVTFKNFDNSTGPRECEGNIQGTLGTLKSLPNPNYPTKTPSLKKLPKPFRL